MCTKCTQSTSQHSVYSAYGSYALKRFVCNRLCFPIFLVDVLECIILTISEAILYEKVIKFFSLFVSKLNRHS